MVPVVFFVIGTPTNEILKLQLETFQRYAKPINTFFINSNCVSSCDLSRVVRYAAEYKIKNYFWQPIEHRGIFST
jgi:hypothetical protein